MAYSSNNSFWTRTSAAFMIILLEKGVKKKSCINSTLYLKFVNICLFALGGRFSAKVLSFFPSFSAILCICSQKKSLLKKTGAQSPNRQHIASSVSALIPWLRIFLRAMQCSLPESFSSWTDTVRFFITSTNACGHIFNLGREEKSSLSVRKK